MNDSPATLELAAQGRLTQRCPSCSTTEAAGFSCTSCSRPTGPQDWYQAELSPTRLAGLAKARIARVRRSGQTGAEIPVRPDVDSAPTLGLVISPAVPAFP